MNLDERPMQIDAKRAEAYSNLIEQILNCRGSDEIVDILDANPELVDKGLVVSAELSAITLELRGNPDAAGFLREFRILIEEGLDSGLFRNRL